MPANLKREFKPSENQIYGDFEVCPLEAERESTMLAACIESGSNNHGCRRSNRLGSYVKFILKIDSCSAPSLGRVTSKAG